MCCVRPLKVPGFFHPVQFFTSFWHLDRLHCFSLETAQLEFFVNNTTWIWMNSSIYGRKRVTLSFSDDDRGELATFFRLKSISNFHLNELKGQVNGRPVNRFLKLKMLFFKVL